MWPKCVQNVFKTTYRIGVGSDPLPVGNLQYFRTILKYRSFGPKSPIGRAFFPIGKPCFPIPFRYLKRWFYWVPILPRGKKEKGAEVKCNLLFLCTYRKSEIRQKTWFKRMTEEKFWDKFRENHNLKYYYAPKKNKEIQKSKYLY